MPLTVVGSRRRPPAIAGPAVSRTESFDRLYLLDMFRLLGSQFQAWGDHPSRKRRDDVKSPADRLGAARRLTCVFAPGVHRRAA